MPSSHLARAVRRIEALADGAAARPAPDRGGRRGVCARRCRSTRSSWPRPIRTRCSGSAPASCTACRAASARRSGSTSSRCPDFNKFSDLARAPAQRRRPARRDRRAPAAQRALARAAHPTWTPTPSCARRFNAGGRGWGLLHLNRAGTPHGFSDDEVAFVETIAPDRRPRAAALADLASRPRGAGRCAPGMAIVDAEQPPRLRHPRGAGLVRRARVDLPAARPRARPRRAERGHDRRPAEARARGRGRDAARARAPAAASGCSSTPPACTAPTRDAASPS